MSGPSLKDVVDLARTYLSEPVVVRDDGRPSWADELGMALCAMVAELHLSDFEADEFDDPDDLHEFVHAAGERVAEVWELCTTPDPVCADPDCLEFGEHSPRDERWCPDHCPDCGGDS